MLLTITKYFFITLCIFYFYKKLLSIPSKKGTYIMELSCSLLLTLVVQFLKPYIGMLELSTLVLLCSLVLMFYYKIPFKTSLLTTTLSFIFSIFSTTIALYLTIPIKIIFFFLSFVRVGFIYLTVVIIVPTLTKVNYFKETLFNFFMLPLMLPFSSSSFQRSYQ